MTRSHRRFATLLLGATMAASLGGAPAATAGPLDPIIDTAAAILDPVSDPVKEFYEEALRPAEDEIVQGLRELRDELELGQLITDIDELLDDTVLEDLLGDGD